MLLLLLSTNKHEIIQLSYSHFDLQLMEVTRELYICRIYQFVYLFVRSFQDCVAVLGNKSNYRHVDRNERVNIITAKDSQNGQLTCAQFTVAIKTSLAVTLKRTHCVVTERVFVTIVQRAVTTLVEVCSKQTQNNQHQISYSCMPFYVA